MKDISDNEKRAIIYINGEKKISTKMQKQIEENCCKDLSL